MTTANKITIFRVVLIPVFLVLMYLRFPGHMYWAFGVFVLASLSDFVDGYIARHYNQITDFGKFMDPLADKLLVVSAMLMFVEQHQMPAWALLLVVARRAERFALDRAAHGLAVKVVEEGVDQTAEIHTLTRRAALTQAFEERLVHVKAERIALLRDGEHLAVLRQRVVRDELIHNRLRICDRDGRLRIRDVHGVGAQVARLIVREIDLAGRVHAAGGGRLRRWCLRRGGLLRRVLPAAGAQQRQHQHARQQE